MLVAALGVVLAQRVGQSVEAATVGSSARMVGATTQFVIASGMASTERPTSPNQQRALARAMHDHRMPTRIIEVRALLDDGTVAYSNQPGLLGKRSGDPATLRRALRAGTAARVVTSTSPNLGTPAYVELVRRNGRLLEVYTTVRVPNSPFNPLVVVFSLPYAPLAATIAEKKRELFAVLFGGLAILYLVLFRLVATASRRLRTQVDENRRLALHDALTGLPNRALLADRIERAAKQIARRGGSAAVLLIDLDRFKEINDTLGHAYGDVLLVQVAQRLTETLRDADTAARLGGDEFCVLALDVDGLEGARELGARVIAALHEPFQADGVTLDVEASIGIALAPNHGGDADTLLRCADVAMYTAKQDKLGISCYDATADHNTPARLGLLGELRRALEAGDQLVLHYQPKVDITTGRLVGVEALVRWQHPERGLVPPGEFIPVAEGTGLIHALTDHVIDEALRQSRCWSDAGEDIQVAVNVSTRCLLDLTLPGRVTALLERHGVPARLLRIEITEDTLMADPARALVVLNELNEIGVRISVDDFGTGYSSMTYLKSLPVDELKVDRSFVLDMQREATTNILVRSVVDLGHNLGLSVVAEGVEEHATLSTLQQLGCDIAQGFYLARPMPPEALTARMLSGQPYVPEQQDQEAA